MMGLLKKGLTKLGPKRSSVVLTIFARGGGRRFRANRFSGNSKKSSPMSSKASRFHPKARKEFQEATRWCRDRSPVAPIEFRAAVRGVEMVGTRLKFFPSLARAGLSRGRTPIHLRLPGSIDGGGLG